MTPGLGSFVEYRDRYGKAKLALVVATSAAEDAASGVSAPQPGRAHLMVFSFSGNMYPKHDVAPGDGPSTFTVPEGLEAVFFTADALQAEEAAENEAAAGLI